MSYAENRNTLDEVVSADPFCTTYDKDVGGNGHFLDHPATLELISTEESFQEALIDRGHLVLKYQKMVSSGELKPVQTSGAHQILIIVAEPYQHG
jgi:hypothetical protein